MYGVSVDCQVYHRTWCHWGSCRSSADWPLWQFSTRSQYYSMIPKIIDNIFKSLNVCSNRMRKRY
jgi:hypothetical protein